MASSAVLQSTSFTELTSLSSRLSRDGFPSSPPLNPQIPGDLFFMAWFVYIIYSKSHDIYYKGESEFPQRRLQEHNNEKD